MLPLLTDKVVYVLRDDRGHLLLLYVRAPPLGQQDHDVDPLEPGDRRDGRRAGVARGPHQDGHVLPPLGEEVLVELAHHGEREILPKI